MVKQNSTRRSILDSPQVNCTACVHWSGEHVFHCLKARTLTICMDKWCIYFAPKQGIEMPIITENKSDVKPAEPAKDRVRNFAARKKPKRK